MQVFSFYRTNVKNRSQKKLNNKRMKMIKQSNRLRTLLYVIVSIQYEDLVPLHASPQVH